MGRLMIALAATASVLNFALFVPAQSQKADSNRDSILKRFAGEFISVTPGKGKFPASFQMGSTSNAEELPAHRMTFNYSFAICKYETTQELYKEVVGNNPSRWQGPRNSVEMVSWDEANQFCRQVTTELRKRELIAANDTIRLPSEAEWEYVCRAGTGTNYSFGDSAQDLTLFGWFTGNAKGNDPPVGAKKANPWDLYDVHGYIWEWCADTWHPNYKGAPGDGSAWSGDSKERVVRGGAWTEAADKCRSASRHHEPANTQTAAIGFRCLRIRGNP